MSAETRAELERAVLAHFMDEANEPIILTDWVVLGASVGNDVTSNGYHYAIREHTPAHQLVGLMVHLTDKFRLRYAQTMEREE